MMGEKGDSFHSSDKCLKVPKVYAPLVLNNLSIVSIATGPTAAQARVQLDNGNFSDFNQGNRRLANETGSEPAVMERVNRIESCYSLGSTGSISESENLSPLSDQPSNGLHRDLSLIMSSGSRHPGLAPSESSFDPPPPTDQLNHIPIQQSQEVSSSTSLFNRSVVSVLTVPHSFASQQPCPSLSQRTGFDSDALTAAGAAPSSLTSSLRIHPTTRSSTPPSPLDSHNPLNNSQPERFDKESSINDHGYFSTTSPNRFAIVDPHEQLEFRDDPPVSAEHEPQRGSSLVKLRNKPSVTKLAKLFTKRRKDYLTSGSPPPLPQQAPPTRTLTPSAIDSTPSPDLLGANPGLPLSPQSPLTITDSSESLIIFPSITPAQQPSESSAQPSSSAGNQSNNQETTLAQAERRVKPSLGRRIARRLSFSSRKASKIFGHSPDPAPPPIPSSPLDTSLLPKLRVVTTITSHNQSQLFSSPLPLTDHHPPEPSITQYSAEQLDGVFDRKISPPYRDLLRSSSSPSPSILSGHNGAVTEPRLNSPLHRPQPTRSKTCQVIDKTQKFSSPTHSLSSIRHTSQINLVSPINLNYSSTTKSNCNQSPELFDQETDFVGINLSRALPPLRSPPFDQALSDILPSFPSLPASQASQAHNSSFLSHTTDTSFINPFAYSNWTTSNLISPEIVMCNSPSSSGNQPFSLPQLTNNDSKMVFRKPVSYSETDDSTTSGGDEQESDDDVPLGQSHPDALKVQASLRLERAKRRAARDAERSEVRRSGQQISGERQEEEKRNLDFAAAAAKLTMKLDPGDEDDNKPLGLIQRQKSVAKSNLRDPFAIAPEELCQRLELICNAKKAEEGLNPLQDNNVLQAEPIGHPLLPQTDASVRSRKQSAHGQRLEPLSPFIQESVLTMGDDDVDSGNGLKSRSIPTNQARRPSRSTNDNNLPSTESHTRHNPAQNISSSHSPHSGTRDILLDHKNPALKRGQTLAVKKSNVDNGPSSESHFLPNLGMEANPVLRRGKTTIEKKKPTNFINSPSHAAQSGNRLPSPQPQPSSGIDRSKSVVKKNLALPPLNTTLETTESFTKSPVSPRSPNSLNQKLLIKVGVVKQSSSMMIEIDEDTCVNDLLKEAENNGELQDDGGKGSWGVIEVWKELGIERPIRETEPIISIVKTWTAVDTSETHLLIKRDDLSGLAVSKRSVTSGVFGGNLWCELKPGKWSKKYVVLRDNAVYLCSNDKGKDEMFLCNLAKFDVYQVPKWAHDALKPPREHAFGLKSLDKLSFFETKSDFVHKFCCKDKLLQLEWIRRLYDARTFYLMSQGSSQEDQGSTAMNRLRSTDAPSSRPIGDRGKPGVARSGTLAGQSSLHSRKDKNDHETEQIKLRKAKASNQSQGVSSLSRKPTLINPESLSKFRQGTLLGDLGGHVAAPSNGPTSGGRPVLPPHVMPLSQDKSWSSEEKGAPGLASVTLKARTWEKMGPQERKEYLMEVQNRAKAEGRTLLKFESEGKSDHFSESHGLLRSKTIAVDRKKKAR